MTCPIPRDHPPLMKLHCILYSPSIKPEDNPVARWVVTEDQRSPQRFVTLLVYVALPAMGHHPRKRSPYFRQRAEIQPGRCLSRGDPVLSPKNLPLPEGIDLNKGNSRSTSSPPSPGKAILMFATKYKVKLAKVISFPSLIVIRPVGEGGGNKKCYLLSSFYSCPEALLPASRLGYQNQ